MLEDKDLMHIRISKIIPAQKSNIIRLLTHVWEFPAYIPTVKEVEVLERKHNILITRWRVQVDGVPISWVEEDTLALRQDTIFFKTVKGDLQEFRGEWKFAGYPQGTQVSVDVYLKVGVPVIKDFADEYIKKLLTKNFEAILDALERRLISIRYASYKQGNIDKISGFGIIGHLYNFRHLEKCLKMLKPDFVMPSREFLGQLLNITPTFKLHDILNFKSLTGQTSNGCVILTTFIPDMIEKDAWTIFAKVIRACKIAEKHGIGIVTLGGFTSIVVEKIGQEISKEVDVPVTTGNTFTAAMAIDGIAKAANLLNLDMANAKVAIVGGSGDIGSACGRALVDNVKQLTLTGRKKVNLSRVCKELDKKHKARVIATTDNEKAVRDADIVIACASATSSILSTDWFKPGAIICDVGYPKNISYTPIPREDILIFAGGLAKSPTSLEFPVDLGLPNAATVYGYYAEGIILALERRFENFSFGRGNITPEKIDEIRRLGAKHGFAVSDFYWGESLIGASAISRLKGVINENKD